MTNHAGLVLTGMNFSVRKFMKQILKDLRSGLYFKSGATWTKNPEEAFVYGNIEGALEAAHSSSMLSLELNILLFDDLRYSVRVALNEFFRPSRERWPGCGPGEDSRPMAIDSSNDHAIVGG